MLLIHPIVQASAIFLAVITLLMGLQRSRSLHLRQQARFPWKWHVLTGKIALGTLMAGIALGLVMVRYHWGRNFITLSHGTMAMVLLPFLLFGFVSGLVLDRNKRGPKALQILHGINNVVVLLLALNQARTGLEIYKMFVAGL